MSYYADQAIDTRTCGEADEDARLDRIDGLTLIQAKVLAWQARQPAFTGRHDTHIGGKGARQAAKAKLRKGAGGR